MNAYQDAALKLHTYLKNTFWTGTALLGPDPGVRFNSRIWRFLKSYMRFIPWNDNRYFLQCQGYWIRNNWELFESLNDPVFKNIAIACTDHILNTQKKQGYWEYPLPEWKGRIATVDGDYAALGLLATFRRTQDRKYLKSVLRWTEFLIHEIGFQVIDDAHAINYFSKRGDSMVPNNTTLTLELFAELYQATQDKKSLESCRNMIQFLRIAQLPSGELPYAYPTPWAQGRIHFLCYQYNAFQFLDLANYWEITKDQNIYPILQKLIDYLTTGLDKKGHSKYNCFKSYPEVTYYTAVLGAAFLKATEIGLGNFELQEDTAYQNVLKKQNKLGGFIYSNRNYILLHDKRSYPRYLAMILRHLLMKAEKEQKNRK